LAREQLYESRFYHISFCNSKFDEDHSLWWEEEGEKRLKYVLDSAEWNSGEGYVILYDAYDDRKQDKCHDYDDFVLKLEEIASDETHNYMPREDGDYVFEFDEEGAVESVLEDYQDKLDEMGWG